MTSFGCRDQGRDSVCPVLWMSTDVISIATDHQMFMTLTGELSWQRLRRSAVDSYSKSEKIAFCATLSGLRGNVCTPSVAHWKACGRLYIHRNWTFFAISYYWDVINGNVSKSAFFEVGRSLWAQISSPTKHCWCQKSRVIGISCGIKMSAVHHLVLSQYASDRRADRQTELWREYHALHYVQSNSKNAPPMSI